MIPQKNTKRTYSNTTDGESPSSLVKSAGWGRVPQYKEPNGKKTEKEGP